MSNDPYIAPLAPTGRSAAFGPPPWHFSGRVLVVEIRVEVAAAAALIPADTGLVAQGDRAAIGFASWQFTRDGGEELRDPVRALFHEAFALVGCTMAGRPAAWCPFMWVDQSVAVVRGLVQGLPKKHGAIRLLPPLSVGRGSRLQAGGIVAASLAADDRRIATAVVTMREPVQSPPEIFLRRLVNRRLLPTLAPGTRGVDEMVISTLRDVEWASCWRGDAELELLPAPHDELSALAPREVLDATWFEYAETVAGGAPVRASEQEPGV
jgi:acetoacetate decarboxylase